MFREHIEHETLIPAGTLASEQSKGLATGKIQLSAAAGQALLVSLSGIGYGGN
jgi:hypothetical protein